MLRIIAGKFRSRVLEQPPLNITRPTIDRVREAIFNIIQNEIGQSIVLDCFAGSGSFCLEAISRGAMKAVAIEKDRRAFQVIERNAKKLIVNNLEIKNIDALFYVKSSKNIQFDFIYLDPPYKLEILPEIISTIHENNLLKEYGKIIIETSIEKEIKIPSFFVPISEKIYGKTKIIFLTKNI